MNSQAGVRVLGAIVLVGAALGVFAVQPERRAGPLRAAGNQFTPATATDGRDFLAVWVDQRIESQIHMNLVRGDGEVMFPLPLVLSGTQRRCTNPAVAWNGRAYLVAWADYVDGSGWEISLVRVSPEGRVLDAAPRTIVAGQTSTPWNFGPSFAINGATTILSTPAYDPPGLHLWALDAEDNVVASGVFNRYGGAALTAHRVVPLDSAFLVVTTAYNDVEACSLSLDANGMRFGETRLVDNVDDRYSSTTLLGVVSNGTRAIALFTITGIGVYSVHARPITATTVGERAVVVAESELARSNSGGYYSPVSSLDAIPAGDGFLVAMRSLLREIFDPNLDGPPGRDDVRPPNTVATYETRMATIDVNGRPLGWTRIEGEGGWYDRIAIASNGRNLFAVWSETLLHYPVVYKMAAGLGDAGHLERIPVASSRPGQSSPRIAAGEEGSLVAWREEPANDGVGVIMVRRYGAGGNALGPALRVSTGKRNQTAPHVAFDGRQYLVAWIDSSPVYDFTPIVHRIVARRVSVDGAVLDAEPMVVTSSFFGRSFGLASNGEDFAIACDAAYPFLDSVITVARIRESFDSMRVSAVHAGELKIDSEVEIAARGEDYVVSWLSGNRFTAAVAAASVTDGEPGRVESFWFGAPLVTCTDASCLALAFRGLTNRTLTAIPFAPPSSLPPSSTPIDLAWNEGWRITSLRGESLAAGKVREPAGWSVRAQYLSSDGSAASEEVRAIAAPLIGDFDVAMTPGGFVVAWIGQSGAGAPRVFVRAIAR